MSPINGYSSSSSFSSYAQASRKKPSEENTAEMKQAMYAKADVNGDGKLDETELASFLSKGPGGNKIDSAETFKSFDTDSDGSVSETEMDTGMQALRSQMESNMNQIKFGGAEQENKMGKKAPNIEELFSKADSGEDGSIDETEFSEFLSKGPQADSVDAKQSFADYDVDSDGALSEDEFQAGMKDLMASMPPPPPPPSASKSDSSDSSSSESSTDASSILSSLDADGNGVIDSEEMTSGLKNSQIQKMISAYIQQMTASYASQSSSLLTSLSA